MTVPPNNAGAHAAFLPSRALVVFPASCGWHVYLQQTDGTARSSLKPRLIAKMCLRYAQLAKYSTTVEVLGVALTYLADIDQTPPPWHSGA